MKLFLSFETVLDGEPVYKTFAKPSNEQMWMVELWAKRGTFKRSLIVDCSEPMHVDEFLDDHMPEIAKNFIHDFSDALDKHITFLKLDGKVSHAWEIEHKSIRYGYRAFYENSL